MMNEALDTNTLIRDVKGSLTIELRDADTGKIVEEQKATNFISMATIRHFKWLQRAYYFKDRISNLNAGADDDWAQPACQDALVLSSSTASPSPSTEWQMFGKLIGYSNKATYSGADTLRGTPNAAFCDATSTYTKWAFDWPTQAANGTIGSVGWMSSVQGVNGGTVTGGRYYTSCSNQDIKIVPNNYVRITRVSSTKYFLALANAPTIIETDENFIQVNSYSVGTQFRSNVSLTGLAWDNVNNKLMVLGVNSSSVPILVSYNSTVSSPTTHTITNRDYKGLTFDGTGLLTMVSARDITTVYRVSLTGADVSSFTITLPVWDGGAYGETSFGLSYLQSSGHIYIASLGISGNNNGYPNHSIRAFDMSGNEVMVPVSLALAWGYKTGSRVALNGSGDLEAIDSQQIIYPANGEVRRILLDGLGTRAKLGSAITKTNSQTLRIIYQMDYA